MTSEQGEEADVLDMSKKEVRKKYSTGFIKLAYPESIPLMIDATFDMRPKREFTKSELARKAGLSPESVRSHIQRLEDLNILQMVPDSQPERYALDRESKIVTLLFELDKVVGETRAGESVDDDFVTTQKSSQSLGDELLEVELPRESDYDSTVRMRKQFQPPSVAGD